VLRQQPRWETGKTIVAQSKATRRIILVQTPIGGLGSHTFGACQNERDPVY
jgi:hypothetical protein